MAAPKGNTFAKDSKNKRGKDKVKRKVKESIMECWAKLERNKKSLYSSASANPEWFYTNFVKPMIPKDVDLDLGISTEFAEIIRTIKK